MKGSEEGGEVKSSCSQAMWLLKVMLGTLNCGLCDERHWRF